MFMLKTKSLSVDTLLRVVETFAEGSFDELFNYEWTDVEAFIRAGNDYVPFKDRAKFASAIRQAILN